VANGNEGSGVPPWMNFVFRVGVPAAIAVFLVYRLTGAIEDRLRQMEEIQSTVIGQLSIHMRNSDAAIGLARQLCVNTAKNDEQIRGCLDQATFQPTR
jgi:hypothetical protein